MITIGCAGFSVPATRFFKELEFVEIQETHVAVPGAGTLRRWRREAPPGFGFSMLAPREIGLAGFRPSKPVEQAMATLLEVGAVLESRAAVFLVPPELGTAKAAFAGLKEFLQLARTRFEQVVFEPPAAWDPEAADTLAEETDTLASRDPLKSGLSKRALAYYRMPGPAGHRSRYEDPAIEQLAAQVDAAQQATYVFANVDMFTDAKRFKKALDDR